MTFSDLAQETANLKGKGSEQIAFNVARDRKAMLEIKTELKQQRDKLTEVTSPHPHTTLTLIVGHTYTDPTLYYGYYTGIT